MNPILIQPPQKLQIFSTGITSQIQDDDHATQLRSGVHIGFDHWAPLAAYGLGYLGIAIAWQIDQTQSAVDQKKIDQLGAPGSRTGFNETFAIDQGVDQ